MNSKVCKKLRSNARDQSVGQPARQLIACAQQCTTRYDKDGKNVTPYAECAVNHPLSTRGVYRNLKGGRTIDPRRFEVAAKHRETMMQRMREMFMQQTSPILPPHTPPKEVDGAREYTRGGNSFVARAKAKAQSFMRRFFRKQH